MRERLRLGPMGRRLLAALLLVSLVVLTVHTIGTVVPHLLARGSHGEAVDAGWLVAATGLAVVIALVVSWLLSHRLVTPLEDFLRMTRSFAAGDHSARVPDSGREEIAELTHALNAAAEEVERSERARQRFTDEIAHELRTPLTMLRAGLEELRDGLVPADHETLAALHDQATRLGRIVDDLGQLSAAESQELSLGVERVDLGRVATLALAAREVSMRAAGLVVDRELDSGVSVAGDADRLNQVVGNLLANAALYCRSGDRVTVRVRRERDLAVLEVADTGPGVDPDELPHVFDRGWRGGAARGTQGSGLGLTIVRSLVLAHGGTVEVRNRRGGGALVSVRIPSLPDDARETVGRAAYGGATGS